jgi:hypothetical protein
MNITVRIKDVYGIQQVYPVSREAQLLAQIAGTKTLQPNVIAAVKQLGYTINVEQPEL